MRNTWLAMTQEQALEGFAARLNELCDDLKLPVRGRPEQLARRFKVSREAARKWLQGITYPTTAKRLEICAWGNVTDVWLTTGKGDKHPVATNLSDHQRLAVEYMGHMTMEQQELAVRLLAQLLGRDDELLAASAAVMRLHDAPLAYRGSGKTGSGG